jgi:hypothetical protein
LDDRLRKEMPDAATVSGDILYVDGGAHFGRW